MAWDAMKMPWTRMVTIEVAMLVHDMMVDMSR